VEGTENQKSQGGGYPKEFCEDPFIDLTDETDHSIKSMYNFFGINQKHFVQNLLTRNSQENKLYLFNNFLYQLLLSNSKNQLRIVDQNNSAQALRSSTRV